MLPEFPTKLTRLPRPLVFVRTLESFDGDILCEFRAASGSGLYLEKWCAHHDGVSRFLFVRTERRPIAEYLGGRISMLDLLTISSDGIGFIVDRKGDATVAVYRVSLDDLPKSYLPKSTAYHDESLRPDWDTVPQNFLLDTTWDAKLLAAIEREYLNVFNFAFFTQPGRQRLLPAGLLDYEFDGGFPIMHVYNRLRSAVPKEMRAKCVGVAANSPGVLTIDAPISTADHLAKALKAVTGSSAQYDSLHSWSRLRPSDVDQIPGNAKQHLEALCNALGVDMQVLLPTGAGQVPTPMQILIAGKLIASHYRRLWRLLESNKGVEFVSVKATVVPGTPPPAGVEEDEDEV